MGIVVEQDSVDANEGVKVASTYWYRFSSVFRGAMEHSQRDEPKIRVNFHGAELRRSIVDRIWTDSLVPCFPLEGSKEVISGANLEGTSKLGERGKSKGDPAYPPLAT